MMIDQILTIIFWGVVPLVLMIFTVAWSVKNRLNFAQKILNAREEGNFRDFDHPGNASKLRWIVIVQLMSITGVTVFVGCLITDRLPLNLAQTIFAFILLGIPGIVAGIFMYIIIVTRLKN